MNQLLQLLKRKRPASILGLTLDGNRLEVVSLRRSNGSLQLRQTLAVSLALNPLTDAADLVGQEIRNHLDQAGIRERRCVVCLPLNWVLSLQTQVPEMPEADRASFLQIEAERGFSSAPETLFTAQSFFNTPTDGQYASLLAVPRNQLEALQRVLRAARLKPVLFALGVTALQPAKVDSARVVLLAVRNNAVDLQVTAGGGIVALRSLDGAIDTQGAQKTVSADLVAREIRITLGQLPGGLAEAPGKLKIAGQGEMAKQLVQDLSPRLAALGLKLELMDKSTAAPFDLPLPPETAVSIALALAANYVRGVDVEPDFLPPKVQPWRQLVATRLSPRKLAYASAAAAGLLLCVAAAFGVQQWQISSLQSKWNAIAPTVNELNADQDLIKKFRPWYDTSCRDLQMLRKLKDAFPDDGSVSAKKVEIHDISTVTCSGIARDNESFLKLHAKLGDDTNQVSGLHAEVHGQKPMDFTLTFQWEGGQPNGN
ncbi:MAG: hypothetical protein ACLQU4_11915 [Limisphaerales bacterium]